MKLGLRCGADGFELGCEQALNFRGERLGMGFDGFELPARFWICVRAATDCDHRVCSGMIGFDQFRRAAGPVSVDLVELSAQGGAMTGVVHQQCGRFSVHRDVKDWK